MCLFILTVLFVVLLQNVSAGVYNWTYPIAPRQCSNLTITVSGDIFFPLKALIVPIGPSPLNYEVRKVIEVPFGTNATSVSFLLPYPTGSKFDGFVIDGTGYTRGNTGITWTVLSSDDSSCFDPTKPASPLFNFSLSPPDIAECRLVNIYWNSSTVQGTPSFIALVPGGGYWDISPGKVLTLPNGLGTGYTWRNPVPSTVNLVLIAGDNRGMGSGGFISSVVGPGDTSRDSNGNCLSTGSDSSSNSPSLNVGAIAGGVIGGFALLLLLLFVLHRLHRSRRRRKPLKPRLVDPDMQSQPAAGLNLNHNNDTNMTYEPLYSQPISTTPPPVPRQLPHQQQQESIFRDSEAEAQPPAYTNQSENENIPPVTVPVSSSWKDSTSRPAAHASAGQPQEVQENGVELEPMHLMFDGRG